MKCLTHKRIHLMDDIMFLRVGPEGYCQVMQDAGRGVSGVRHLLAALHSPYHCGL